MPTISQTVAALAKKINPEAPDCYSGNIKTNLDAVIAANDSEPSDLGTISSAIEILTENVGESDDA